MGVTALLVAFIDATVISGVVEAIIIGVKYSVEQGLRVAS